MGTCLQTFFQAELMSGFNLCRNHFVPLTKIKHSFSCLTYLTQFQWLGSW